MPTEFAVDLHDEIVEAGATLGLRHAGAFAFDAAAAGARVPLVGPRHGPARRPVRGGLGFAVASTTDFVGRDALAKLKDGPTPEALVSVHVPEPMLWHGESVLRGDERIGHVTSGRIAPTLGWLRGPRVDPGDVPADGAVALEIRGRTRAGHREAAPFYDPTRRTHVSASFASIGVPIDSVGRAGGTEHAPAALREAGLLDAIGARDAGDLPVRIRGEERDPALGHRGDRRRAGDHGGELAPRRRAPDRPPGSGRSWWAAAARSCPGRSRARATRSGVSASPTWTATWISTTA